MKRINVFRATLLALVVITLFIFFQPRSCKVVPDTPNQSHVIDSLNQANDKLMAEIGKKDVELAVLGNQVDSLTRLKSKVKYKTKYEVVIKYHDSCITYYDSCIKDLQICEQVILIQDSMLRVKESKIDILTMGMDAYKSHSIQCSLDVVAISKENARLKTKIKRKNRAMMWLTAILVGENIVLFAK